MNTSHAVYLLGDPDGTWFVMRHTADGRWESVTQQGEFIHADDSRQAALDIALRYGIRNHLPVLELFVDCEPVTLIDAGEAKRRDTGEPNIRNKKLRRNLRDSSGTVKAV